MKKIFIIFGTRPEAIKMAPVVLYLKEKSGWDIRVCITGQHTNMLYQVLDIFKIKPDYDLNIMRKKQTLYHITTSVLEKLNTVFEKERPGLVMVHGDTTTSFAAALAAYYRQIPVAHVEAGLRSYDKYNPFPEEINRVFVDKISDLLFAPTNLGKQNLIKEQVPANKIFVTGNTVIDALLRILNKRKAGKSRPKYLMNKNSRLILVTAHRRENFGQPITNICHALKKIAELFPDIEIVYPVHPNPNIKEPVYQLLGKIKRIHLIEPLSYPDFINLINESYLVLTDSGGLQEEAPSLGKPVLVLRKVTERPEGVTAGTVEIVGTDSNKIINSVSGLLTDKNKYRKMSTAVNPYGDGKASQRIYKALKQYERSIILQRN